MKSAGSAAESFRTKKYEIIYRISENIEEHHVNAVFILGDLFDSDRVGEQDILKTRIKLSDLNCPIYILPGNHDWWHKGGILYRFDQLCVEEEDIHILKENAPFSVNNIPNVTFFPCPNFRKYPICDPSEQIPERISDHGVRIALLHGSMDTAPGGIIPKDVTRIRDLDFTFLGDWHKPIKIDEKTIYCGSPKTMGFDETHKGQIILANVQDGEVNTENIIIGKLAWNSFDINFEPKEYGGRGLQELIQEIQNIDTPKESTVIRLKLSGILSWEEFDQLNIFLEELPLYGWANIDIDASRVKPLQDIDLDTFPDAIKNVAIQVMDSDNSNILKRKALFVLKKKFEEIQCL